MATKLQLHIAFDRALSGLEIKSYAAFRAADAPRTPTELYHVVAADAPIEFKKGSRVFKGGDFERERNLSALIGASLSKEDLLQQVQTHLIQKQARTQATVEAFTAGIK